MTIAASLTLVSAGTSWSKVEIWLWWLAIIVIWPVFLYFIAFITGAPTYKFFCPNCRKRYAHSLSRVLLGRGSRKCRKCLREFDDSSQEWHDFARSAKFEYLFPPTILILLGLAIVCGVLGYEMTHPDDAIDLGLLGFLMFAFPTVPYFFGRWWQIRKSKLRREAQELARIGYRPL